MLSINNIKGNLQERDQNQSQADQENCQSKVGTREEAPSRRQWDRNQNRQEDSLHRDRWRNFLRLSAFCIKFHGAYMWNVG